MTTANLAVESRPRPEPESGEPAIRIDDISQSFDSRAGTTKLALREVSFDVPKSGFYAVVGPSGCGKSTLLNLISGLLTPTKGSVTVNGERVTGIRHDIGYMPSADSLLPWRTVRNNVAFPLELAGVPKKERYARADEMLAAVGLAPEAREQYPHALSQGMRQRVAIARTFSAQSSVILMDEPFSALDAQTRLRVQDLFLSIWDREKPTVVLITHDVAEAVTLADKVVVFTKGPGTVDRIIDVKLARPRSAEDLLFDSTEFQGYMREIWTSFRDKEVDE